MDANFITIITMTESSFKQSALNYLQGLANSASLNSIKIIRMGTKAKAIFWISSSTFRYRLTFENPHWSITED